MRPGEPQEHDEDQADGAQRVGKPRTVEGTPVGDHRGKQVPDQPEHESNRRGDQVADEGNSWRESERERQHWSVFSGRQQPLLAEQAQADHRRNDHQGEAKYKPKGVSEIHENNAEPGQLDAVAGGVENAGVPREGAVIKARRAAQQKPPAEHLRAKLHKQENPDHEREDAPIHAVASGTTHGLC